MWQYNHVWFSRKEDEAFHKLDFLNKEKDCLKNRIVTWNERTECVVLEFSCWWQSSFLSQNLNRVLFQLKPNKVIVWKAKYGKYQFECALIKLELKCEICRDAMRIDTNEVLIKQKLNYKILKKKARKKESIF